MLPKICKIVLYNIVKHGLHVCLEQEVECDAQAGELEEVGEHGDWGEVLEVPDADQEQQGHQHPRHVHAVVSVGGGVRVPEHRLQHLWTSTQSLVRYGKYRYIYILFRWCSSCVDILVS